MQPAVNASMRKRRSGVGLPAAGRLLPTFSVDAIPDLRARARITWHFAAGPQARWRDASDELYPGWYVRSEQQSQRACGPQPERARRQNAN